MQYFINKSFFKNWTRAMAYVLGYFTADGSMFVNRRGAYFIDFTSIDRELIEKVKRLLRSRHKTGIYRPKNINWHRRYRLEIGSKEMFRDLLKLGLKPQKSKTIQLPKIPKRYFSDFVRGYFDGDGCVSFGSYPRKHRKGQTRLLSVRFVSGSQKFLKDLWKSLKEITGLKGGFVTLKGKSFELHFSINDSKKLYKFMYNKVPSSQFLERKYQKYQQALKFMGM